MGKKHYKYAVADKKIKGIATWKYFANYDTAKKFAEKRQHIIEPIKSKKQHLEDWNVPRW